MSGEKEEDGDELIVMPRAALECCRIYTQHVYEGKGAPAAASEAFLSRVGHPGSGRLKLRSPP